MSGRAPKPPVGIAKPGIIAADPANRQPAVPDTMPLASDQSTAPAAPIATAPITGAVDVVGADRVDDTGPAVMPGVSVDHVPTAPKPPLVKVDGTVPLPSDQMTALVPAVSTEPGAPAAMPSVVPPRPSVPVEAARVGMLGDYPPELLELVRQQVLADLGLDVVGQPVNAVAFDRPADVAEEAASTEEYRAFRVNFDVNHDGKPVAPGARIDVTQAQHERLFAGSAITLPWHEGDRIL